MTGRRDDDGRRTTDDDENEDEDEDDEEMDLNRQLRMPRVRPSVCEKDESDLHKLNLK